MKTLQKQPGKDFTVLNLTDTQLSNDEWAEGHLNRRILEHTVTELVKRVQPDLITISGDLAWAGHGHAYDMLGAFLDCFQIPWAPVWGNHDNQDGPQHIEVVISRFSKCANFLYESGDPAIGNGNYVIRIEESGKTVAAIVMMDSHDREPHTNEKGETWNQWARLTKPQLAWYESQMEALKAMGCGDVTVVMHIPIYAYRLATRAAYKGSVKLEALTLEESYGPDCWNEGYTDSVGVQYEGIGSYPEDDGALEVFQKSGITKRVVSGHDHVNNWIIPYEGIQLIYALKTGPGCYWKPILNGGTVLKVGEHGVYAVCHEYVDISGIQ